MASITYAVMKKPIEERLIDAGCIYWDVERSYFMEKTKNSTVVHRKAVLYYLIKQHTVYDYPEIALMFGFIGRQPVIRLIEIIECRKNIYKQILNDIRQIEAIADTLDAEFITNDIRLFNKSTSKDG